MGKAMKFEIYRTSDWCRENPPCEGARLVRAGSAVHSAVYEIEIETLEQLLELMQAVESPIIIMGNYDEPTIEIYDDYRE